MRYKQDATLCNNIANCLLMMVRRPPSRYVFASPCKTWISTCVTQPFIHRGR